MPHSLIVCSHCAEPGASATFRSTFPWGRQTIIFRQVLGEISFRDYKRFVLLDIGRRALERKSAAVTMPLLGR